MLASSARVLLNSSRGTATAYRLCRGSTTGFLPFLSKTPQSFYSVPPVSDSPIKGFNGMADHVFQRHFHNSPTSFTSSRRDATISKQCQEFQSSNDHDVQQPTNLVKESCFGSLSPQADVNVSKPDQNSSEWSLFEAKKLQDEVESDQVLSGVSQVEVRQQDLLNEQAKMGIMLGEISEWQKKILHTLELGDKRQQDTGLSTSQAKMRKMMKKILASQMKVGQVEDTIHRAHSKCSEMENQILQILEGMEATQRRSFSMYEQMESKYEGIKDYIRNNREKQTSSLEIPKQILQRLEEMEATQRRNFSIYEEINTRYELIEDYIRNNRKKEISSSEIQKQILWRLEEMETAQKRNFFMLEEVEDFIKNTKDEDIESFIRNNRKKETTTKENLLVLAAIGTPVIPVIFAFFTLLQGL